MGKFNLIGFNRYNIDTKEYRHCSIHPYKRLLHHKTDQDLLFCPECGSEFPVKIEDSSLEQGIQSKFGANNKTKIVTAKRKRKHYDNFGALVPENDPISIKESQGAGFKKLIAYSEKVEENGDVYVAW